MMRLTDLILKSLKNPDVIKKISESIVENLLKNELINIVWVNVMVQFKVVMMALIIDVLLAKKRLGDK